MLASSYQPPPLIRMMPRPVEQAAILDQGGRALKSPRGDKPARYLRRPLFILLEMVTRHPGIVVEYASLKEAIWPDAYKPLDEQLSLHVYTNTVRNLLEEQGWPRDVLITRTGVGLQLDKQLAQETMDAAHAANGVQFD